MKKILLSTLLVVTGCLAFSQAPDAFNYQTVIGDNQGNPIQNTNVSFRFTISQDTMPFTPDYTETQTIVTNFFGVVALVIGKGTPVFGTFNSINWDSGNHYLTVEIDINSTGTFIHMGTAQLLSVPYALYANKAGTSGPLGQSSTNYYGRGYVFVNATDTAYQTIAGLDTTITATANCTTLLSATGSVYGTSFSCFSSLRATLFIDGVAPALGGTQVLNIVTDNNISSGGANWTINYPTQLSAGAHTVTVKVKSNSLQNECSLTVDNGGFFDHSTLTVTFLRN
jgi:hypothetical protein